MIDDAHDRSVERFARVTPPPGHQARVLARSGPGTDAAIAARETWRSRAWHRTAPLAATVGAVFVAAVGLGVYTLTYHPSRPVALVPPAPEASWTGKGVDLPVLPPRAYWQMSALDEFEQLRPGALANEDGPRSRDASSAIALTATHATSQAAPATQAAPSRPSSLAPIALDDITAAPIAIAALEPLPPIALAPIVIVPIAISPVAEEDQ